MRAVALMMLALCATASAERVFKLLLPSSLNGTVWVDGEGGVVEWTASIFDDLEPGADVTLSWVQGSTFRQKDTVVMLGNYTVEADGTLQADGAFGREDLGPLYADLTIAELADSIEVPFRFQVADPADTTPGAFLMLANFEEVK